jgi:hypothetical protein
MPFFLRLLALTCALIGSAAAVETQLIVDARDDNLPRGTLTYTWSVSAFPAGATGSNQAQISPTPNAAFPNANEQNPRVVLRVAGTYKFRVEVFDGHQTTSSSAAQEVTVVVNPPPNTAPTLSAIQDQLIARNGATGALPFTVTDNAANLKVEWETTNATLVPTSAVELAGTGASRTIKVTPARDQSGTATITVKVTDAGGLTSSIRFTLTVNAPPTITRTSAAQTTLTLP